MKLRNLKPHISRGMSVGRKELNVAGDRNHILAVLFIKQGLADERGNAYATGMAYVCLYITHYCLLLTNS